MDEAVENFKTPAHKRETWRKYYYRNRERLLESSRDRKRRERDHKADYAKRASKLRTKEEWPKFILAGLRHRAKKKGLEFNIEASDIVVPDHCPVLGIPIQVNTGQHPRRNYDSPSVDRINNELGYVKGNVRVISSRANSLKSDASFEEIEAIFLDLLSRRDLSDENFDTC